MNTKRITPLFIALVVAIMTFACGGTAATATSVPEQPATQAAEVAKPTAETVSEAAGDLEIISVTSYVDAYNDYNVAGEIKNNTNRTLENITLNLSIKDANGTSVLTDSSDAAVDSVEIQPFIGTLAPGTGSPFSYYMSIDDQAPADFDVSIASYDQVSAPELAKIDLANVNSAELDNGNVIITGELVNLSDEQVELESVAGSMLNEDLQVLGANSSQTYQRYLYPAGDADKRDRTPFIVLMYGPLENATRWKVYARAIESTSTPSEDVQVQWSNSYFDPYGTYHMLGTLTNNGSEQLSPSLLGSVQSPDQAILDVASVNVPIYLNAGESVGFDITAFQVMNYIPDDTISGSDMNVRPDLYWTFPTDYEVVNLTANDVSLTQNDYDWTVRGTVVNTSDKPLSSVSIVAQISDASGQLVATNSVGVYPPDGSETIDPGDSLEFEITLYTPDGLDLSNLTQQFFVQGIVAQ